MQIYFYCDFLIGVYSNLQSLSFQKINRIITAVDSQPMFDGGVLINVLGRLQVSTTVYFNKCKSLINYFDRLMKMRLMGTSKRSY